MVKKLIGIVVALAVIVVIVLATISHDEFRSMVWQDELQEADEVAPVRSAPVQAVPVEKPDSVAVHAADSL